MLGDIANILEVRHVTPFIAFPSLSFQPFTEVTLQMSHNKSPTIPFVLPLYQKMEKHLESVANSCEYSFRIQRVAERGLEKLHKYLEPAKLHHSYIIGTGMTFFTPCLSFVVSC